MLCHSPEIRGGMTGAMLGDEQLRWQLLSSSTMVQLLPLVEEVAQHACRTLADAIRRSAPCAL